MKLAILSALLCATPAMAQYYDGGYYPYNPGYGNPGPVYYGTPMVFHSLQPPVIPSHAPPVLSAPPLQPIPQGPQMLPNPPVGSWGMREF